MIGSLPGGLVLQQNLGYLSGHLHAYLKPCLEASAECFRKNVNPLEVAVHQANHFLVHDKGIDSVAHGSHEVQAVTELIELGRSVKYHLWKGDAHLIPLIYFFEQVLTAGVVARYGTPQCNMHEADKFIFPLLFSDRFGALVVYLVPPLAPRDVQRERNANETAYRLGPRSEVNCLRLRKAPPLVEEAPSCKPAETKPKHEQYKRVSCRNHRAFHLYPLVLALMIVGRGRVREVL